MLYPNRFKILIIYKNFSSKYGFFFKSLINRKEPEPQSVILAPALGGNLISVPAPQHWVTTQ
jgi:hypothetical protein